MRASACTAPRSCTASAVSLGYYLLRRPLAALRALDGTVMTIDPGPALARRCAKTCASREAGRGQRRRARMGDPGHRASTASTASAGWSSNACCAGTRPPAQICSEIAEQTALQPDDRTRCSTSARFLEQHELLQARRPKRSRACNSATGARDG